MYTNEQDTTFTLNASPQTLRACPAIKTHPSKQIKMRKCHTKPLESLIETLGFQIVVWFRKTQTGATHAKAKLNALSGHDEFLAAWMVYSHYLKANRFTGSLTAQNSTFPSLIILNFELGCVIISTTSPQAKVPDVCGLSTVWEFFCLLLSKPCAGGNMVHEEHNTKQVKLLRPPNDRNASRGLWIIVDSPFRIIQIMAENLGSATARDFFGGEKFLARSPSIRPAIRGSFGMAHFHGLPAACEKPQNVACLLSLHNPFEASSLTRSSESLEIGQTLVHA